MRALVPALLALACVLIFACSRGGSSPTDPADGTSPAPHLSGALGESALVQGDLALSAIGLWTMTLDPAGPRATIELKDQRALQENDDVITLSVDNFLSADTIQIRAVRINGSNLEVDYTFTHPFTGPSGSYTVPPDRCDLSIAAQLLFLFDDPAPIEFFDIPFGGSVRANTTALTNQDGYVEQNTCLFQVDPLFNTNTFPYKLLVDEVGVGNRVGLPNGGTPTGNYNPSYGWGRTQISAGATGYGLLAQGQTALNTASFDLAWLQSAGPISFDIVCLAKYSDPRGGVASATKRANRCPGATNNLANFVYRMPHGALDMEKLEFEGIAGTYDANITTSPLIYWRIRDWDARALESSQPDLKDELTTASLVAIGESGVPNLVIDIPDVIESPQAYSGFADIVDDDTLFGGDPAPDSGQPGDELVYGRGITGTPTTAGDYTGMVRAIDAGNIGFPSEWRFFADGAFPAPGPCPPPQTELFTYQTFPVTVGTGIPISDVPTGIVTITTPVVISGNPVQLAVSYIEDTDDATLDLNVDYDDDTVIDFTMPVTGSGQAQVNLSSAPITFPWSGGPGNDMRDLHVFLDDGVNNVELTSPPPAGDFQVGPPGTNLPPNGSFAITSADPLPEGLQATVQIVGMTDDANSPISITVDFNDGFGPIAAPGNPYGFPYPPSITLSSTNTYTWDPPAPDLRPIVVRLADSQNTRQLIPQAFEVERPPNLPPTGTAGLASQSPLPAGVLAVVGVLSLNDPDQDPLDIWVDFDNGAGLVEHPDNPFTYPYTDDPLLIVASDYHEYSAVYPANDFRTIQVYVDDGTVVEPLNPVSMRVQAIPPCSGPLNSFFANFDTVSGNNANWVEGEDFIPVLRNTDDGASFAPTGTCGGGWSYFRAGTAAHPWCSVNHPDYFLLDGQLPGLLDGGFAQTGIDTFCTTCLPANPSSPEIDEMRDWGRNLENNIVSPTFSLVNMPNAQISFAAIVTGRAGASFNGYISNDNGITWAPIFVYNQTALDPNPADISRLDDAGLHDPPIHLPGPYTSQTRLRFQWKDPATTESLGFPGTVGGWALDSVRVESCY